MPEHIVDRTQVNEILANLWREKRERLVYAMPDGGRYLRIITVTEPVALTATVTTVGGGGGGGGTNPVAGGAVGVTINTPVGSSGEDVVRAIKEYEKRHGPGWRS